jgi:hypothetical protein
MLLLATVEVKCGKRPMASYHGRYWDTASASTSNSTAIGADVGLIEHDGGNGLMLFLSLES